MNAPIVWIAVPLATAMLIWLIRSERWIAGVGGAVTLLLTGIAIRIPIDTAVSFGPLSFRINPTISILGRQLTLSATDQPILVIVYGITAFWLIGSFAAGPARRLVPLGLAITALLVASLAVEPFLYAALILELAVLLAIPLLAPPGQKPGHGVLRFLIFQTLSMPFILLAGFLLAGVEASPADLALVVQSATLLGLGFSFLLAIFPFYTWIPMLAEETHPYVLGFILILFPTFGTLFGMGFLDRYTWLRESPLLADTLRLAGLLTLVTAGVWAAFQRHLGRMMAYTVIAETGLSLLALSLTNQTFGVEIVFGLLIPRALGLGVFALSTSVLLQDAPTLGFNEIQGKARTHPFAAGGLVLSFLSLAGIPLLASFPIRQVLWEQLARDGAQAAIWFGIGTLGLWAGAMRTLAVLVMSPEGSEWQSHENWPQRVLLLLGWLGLFILGLLPQWTQPFVASLPLVFERLGR